jgi:hypothetical protein
MGEAGYNIGEFHVSPIVRYEHLSGAPPTQNRIAGGLAFWPYDHNVNLKLFYSHIGIENRMTGGTTVNHQVNLQLQIYYF